MGGGGYIFVKLQKTHTDNSILMQFPTEINTRGSKRPIIVIPFHTILWPRNDFDVNIKYDL